MNLAAGRILARLGNRSNIIQFANREKPWLSLCSTVNVQTRCKVKLARPSLFEYDRRYNDHQNRQNEPTGIYGYLLVGIPIGTFILGTWQVQRRKWKLNLIEDLDRRTKQEPVDLPQNLEELETKEYCPVKVQGTFIHEKEFTIGPRGLIMDGAPASERNPGLIGINNSHRGYYVITPFKVANRDLTILVNRGWVPKELKNPEKRTEGQVKGMVEIIGVVRLNEQRPPFIPKNAPEENAWYYRDLHAMAKKVGTAPVYIEMVHNKDHRGFPIGGQTKVTLRNEHMSYIITWYSLSAITGYMWHRQFIRKLPLL